MISDGSHAVFISLSEILCTMNNTMGATQCATGDLEVLSRSRDKLRHCKNKKKNVELFDTYNRLRSAAEMVAHHFKIKESSIRTTGGGGKKFHEVVTET